MPSLVSRLVQPSMDLVSLLHNLERYYLIISSQRTCLYMFGSNYKNGVATLPNTDATNTKYKGWNTTHPRIYFATGQREFPLRIIITASPSQSLPGDPWREATVSAEGLSYPNTTDHTVGLSTDGYHCSDLLTRESTASASVRRVQQQGLAALARWLPQFKAKQVNSR